MLHIVHAYTLADIRGGAHPPPLGADVRIDVGHCPDWLTDDDINAILGVMAGAESAQVTGNGLGFDGLARVLRMGRQ